MTVSRDQQFDSLYNKYVNEGEKLVKDLKTTLSDLEKVKNDSLDPFGERARKIFDLQIKNLEGKFNASYWDHKKLVKLHQDGVSVLGTDRTMKLGNANNIESAIEELYYLGSPRGSSHSIVGVWDYIVKKGNSKKG